jgi:hypothetical protein
MRNAIYDAFAALPEPVQQCLRDKFIEELRQDFDGMYFELLDAFMSDEAIQQQFNQFREREWMDMQRECEDAWADFLYRHVSQR